MNQRAESARILICCTVLRLMMANSKRIESFTFINDDCRAVDTRSEEGQRQDDRIAKDRISAGIELRRGKKMQPLSRLGAHIYL